MWLQTPNFEGEKEGKRGGMSIARLDDIACGCAMHRLSYMRCAVSSLCSNPREINSVLACYVGRWRRQISPEKLIRLRLCAAPERESDIRGATTATLCSSGDAHYPAADKPETSDPRAVYMNYSYLGEHGWQKGDIFFLGEDWGIAVIKFKWRSRSLGVMR